VGRIRVKKKEKAMSVSHSITLHCAERGFEYSDTIDTSKIHTSMRSLNSSLFVCLLSFITPDNQEFTVIHRQITNSLNSPLRGNNSNRNPEQANKLTRPKILFLLKKDFLKY
jgi:hypothetical protein